MALLIRKKLYNNVFKIIFLLKQHGVIYVALRSKFQHFLLNCALFKQILVQMMEIQNNKTD